MRFRQFLVGLLCMVAVANLQYGWTLFVDPIDQAYGFGRTPIQLAFTLLIIAQTWPVFIWGWLADKLGTYGPGVMIFFAGVCAGLGWLISAHAVTLWGFYAGALLAGTGSGVTIVVTTANMAKWYPKRRGLMVGAMSAGFGMGAILTVMPLTSTIEVYGFQAAFFWFGLIQGCVVMVAAFFVRAPSRRDSVYAIMPPTQLVPARVVRTAPFWVMYCMFALTAAGGLMATAQLALVAQDFGIAKQPVAVVLWSVPALPLALMLDRLANGLSRPFFGWVSDYIGRIETLALAFLAEAAGIVLLLTSGTDPLWFVLCSGLVFFAWGEIYSLFLSLCTDIYGERFASANYGLLYTAKGVASFLVPLGNILMAYSGTWQTVFTIAIGFDLVAAVLALLVLRPLLNKNRLHVSTT